MTTIPVNVRKHLVPAICLTVLTLVVYGRTMGYDFQTNWDDYQYVTHNPDIMGLSIQHLMKVFSSVYVGNYAPIHLLSYMLDYQVAGMSPAWFHGVNVLLHCVNGLLWYLVVLRSTDRPFWALAAAAVFLLHPAQVESVAWVSQRKNLLAMLFSLCSFISYLSFRHQTGNARRRWAYALSILFLVMALFAKSIAVVVPFLFLLYDLFVEQQRRPLEALRDKIPHVIAVAAVSVITVHTQSAEMGGGIVDFFEGDQTAKLLTMLPVLMKYLQILVWPSPQSLNAIYIFRIKTGIDGEFISALLLVLVLSAAGVYLARRRPTLFFGFALFFLGLVPVSQIVPLATLMNDRYLYFPMLGAAWFAGGLLSRLHDHFRARSISPAIILISGITLVLALLSYQRSQVWANSITLWSDVVRKLPDLKDPRGALAQAYLDAGRKEEALAVYQGLFALARDFTEPVAERKALLQTAVLYLEQGDRGRAFPYLAELTTKFPIYPAGFINLGYWHYLGKRLPEAETAYRKALQLDPGSIQAMISLGNICLETGRTAEARVWYTKCLERGGSGSDLHYNLACVETISKDYDAALRHLAEALRLGYRNRDALAGNPELAPLRRLAGYRELMLGYFPAETGKAPVSPEGGKGTGN